MQTQKTEVFPSLVIPEKHDLEYWKKRAENHAKATEALRWALDAHVQHKALLEEKIRQQDELIASKIPRYNLGDRVIPTSFPAGMTAVVISIELRTGGWYYNAQDGSNNVYTFHETHLRRDE